MLQFRAGNYCDINIFPDSEILKLKAHMAFNKGRSSTTVI
jgi:hypothetical protein